MDFVEVPRVEVWHLSSLLECSQIPLTSEFLAFLGPDLHGRGLEGVHTGVQ